MSFNVCVYLSLSIFYIAYLCRKMDKQSRLRAEIKVPVQLAKGCYCGYKYALVNEETNEATYEELSEFKSKNEDIINRCLVIDKEYAAEDSKY